jgi:type I restriction enzyme R subunit
MAGFFFISHIAKRPACGGDPSFIYRQLGERLQRVKERKDAGDEAAARRLNELQEIAAAAATTKQEPERLDLLQPGEYGLFTILRAHAPGAGEGYLADCARGLVGHLRANKLLSPGWSNSIGARMRVEQSLLAESWNPQYAALGFDPDAASPPFLEPAVDELAKSDGTN